MNNPSIFTKIINGEIPCHKVYEDELTLAFLDIYSPVIGHTLVVPKKQVEFLWDLEDTDYQAVTISAQKVAKRLREVLGVPYVGVKVIGVDVPHAHIHLVPFSDTAEYHKAGIENSDPDHESLASLAKRLSF